MTVKKYEFVEGDTKVVAGRTLHRIRALVAIASMGVAAGDLGFLQKDRTVAVRRGCFSGSLDDFRAAIEETHGDSPHGQQYRLLIQFIELRAAEALRDFAPAVATEMEAA